MLQLPNVLINSSITILLRDTKVLVFCNVVFINTNWGTQGERVKYRFFCLCSLCLKANDY